MLSESLPLAHCYLVIIGILVFTILSIYIYVYNHKIDIDNEWRSVFRKYGLSDKDIDLISHDDDSWYYDGISTCVGYGDWNDLCPKYQRYCSNEPMFGNRKMQAKAVIEAIRNSGTHKECPLIYKGTN